MYVLSHNHTFDTLAAITADGELVELEMKIGTRGLCIRLLVEGGDFGRGALHRCLDGTPNVGIDRLAGRIEL